MEPANCRLDVAEQWDKGHGAQLNEAAEKCARVFPGDTHARTHFWDLVGQGFLRLAQL